jgi:hypothetical protein
MFASKTYTTDTETGNSTKSDSSLGNIGRHASQSASESSHEDGRHEEKFSVPALKPTERCICEDGAKGCGERWWDTFETDLDWIVLENVLKEYGEEVEQCEEVHACNKGNTVRSTDDSLTSEHLVWNHGILGEFPLPNDERDYESDANEQLNKDVRRSPRMRVAASLHGNKEENKANDGEESADEVDLAHNLLDTLAMSTSLRCWKVEDRDTNEGDAVPDHGDPDGPAPGVVCAQKLRVHQVRAEWDDGECNQCQVYATLADWHKLGHTRGLVSE